MTSSVNSRISPKRYESLLSEIEPDDMNIKSDLYELSIYDHTIHISPGKTIEDEEIKDLVYCYVYVVKNDKVVQKLGVYERFTKEKEEFFDLSTFEKGTLCLFEKYETNPSLFLEFKSDHEVQEKKRKSKKTKAKEPEAEKEVDLNAEPEPKEVDLNAEEAPVTEAPEPKEVDLNAEEPEPEPKEVDLNAEPEAETKEVDLNAPEPKPKTPVPNLLDVNELDRDLGISETKPKTKIKLKSKAKSPKVKTPSETQAETKAEPKAETKKTRTKKKTTVEGEPPGTKFG
jgi:hypothetical protein